MGRSSGLRTLPLCHGQGATWADGTAHERPHRRRTVVARRWPPAKDGRRRAEGGSTAPFYFRLPSSAFRLPPLLGGAIVGRITQSPWCCVVDGRNKRWLHSYS